VSAEGADIVGLFFCARSLRSARAGGFAHPHPPLGPLALGWPEEAGPPDHHLPILRLPHHRHGKVPPRTPAPRPAFPQPQPGTSTNLVFPQP
jgi:hypothetical protein